MLIIRLSAGRVRKALMMAAAERLSGPAARSKNVSGTTGGTVLRCLAPCALNKLVAPEVNRYR